MDKLKVLVVHCLYQLKGGEDSVVESEVAMLKEAGHDVRLYLRDNADASDTPAWRLAAQTLWSSRTVQDLREVTREWRPDVIHVHNTLLLVSPSVFWAADELGIPVVQTLHNFRAACLGGIFVRNGQVCEDCMGKTPWRGVVRRCYRGSVAQSAVLATMLMTHRQLGTYDHKVTRFIALTEFAKGKLADSGLPVDKIRVKSNFVEWRPAPKTGVRRGGIYVGRLSVEKGIEVLLAALQRFNPGDHQVEVMGTGPFESDTAGQLGSHYLGFQPLPTVLEKMEHASFMVLPSICYEGFPRTIVEAFACGLPVIASRLGSMAELVADQETGLLFEAGNPEDLAQKIAWAHAHPQEMMAMGLRARAVYEQRFNPEQNLSELIGIYREAMAATAP
ncbi:MAG TPA: glycosyltransferase [Aquabacterium sp.]|nr:glycosyltransferase [Aquabacterium sp.]